MQVSTRFLLCAAGVCAGGVALAAPEAREFMADVFERYRGLESYRHDAVQGMEMEFEGQPGMAPAMPESTLRFAYSAPGKFALTGGQLVDVYCDGETLTAHIPMAAKYAETDAGPEPTLSDVPGFYGMTLAQEAPIASLVLDPPANVDMVFAPMSVEWKSVEEGERDGQAGHVVSCALSAGMPGVPATSATIWVSGETGLIGAIEFDMLEQMKAFSGDQGGPEISVAKRTIAYRDVETGEPIPPERFVFEPGEGDEKVDTLPSPQELFQAQMGDTGGGGQAPASGPQPGEAAPSFSAETLGGGTVSLADLEGKVVLLDFWATWCGPCVQAMPSIQDLHEEYGDDGLVVLGISQDSAGAKGKIESFVEDKGITFAQVHDADASIGNEYGVSAIPHSVLIGKDGTVQAVHVGFAPGQEKKYAEEIEALLAGKSLAGG